MTKLTIMLLAAALLAGGANAQSLGEAARQARKKKSAPSPAQKVYTNDNLPTTAPISVMSGSGVDNATSSDKKGDGSTAAAGAAGADSAGAKKEQDQWRSKFAEQKNKIQLLEREVDVIERQHQVQVSVFYADAGTRLRDDRRWADEDRQYKADLESKKKQLADAKQQLDDMREEARKAGMPPSVAD